MHAAASFYPPTPPHLKSLFNDSDVSSSIIYYISIDNTVCTAQSANIAKAVFMCTCCDLDLDLEITCLDLFLMCSVMQKKPIGFEKSQYWLKQMNFLGWSTNHKLNTDAYP